MAPNRSTTEGPRVNERIRAAEVRLVGPDGGQLGVTALADALRQARELDLDLVEVAADADPPVCRLMDYGKHRFEMVARARENRRRSTHSVKEMRYSVRIGPGDFQTKTRKIARFLEDGHRVKVSIRFRRGRELGRPEVGRRLLENIVEQLPGVKVESPPRLDGTFMSMLLAPGPNRAAR